jgi:voltage-gated sodium channel type IV alpha
VLNLFIGVIIQEFTSLKKKYDEQGATGGLFLTEQQKEYVRTITQMLNPKPKPTMVAPTGRFRVWCFNLVNASWFEGLVLAGIVLNTLVFMTKYYAEPSYWGPGPGGLSLNNVTFGLNAFFCAAFAIEAFLKLTGYGPTAYFKSGWNIFDFVVTVLSVVGVAVDVVASRHGARFPTEMYTRGCHWSHACLLQALPCV